jgi:glutamate racemase
LQGKNPIGVFDSGAGGLTVLNELLKVLPGESFVYFADSANCPYGPKPQSEVVELSNCITRFLLEQGCKLVVVACNTATAAAIEHLRSSFKIPFIGMEPAIKPASLNSKTKSIGVLATAGTFKGKLYIETSKKYASDVNVCYQVGEGLVELVEAGKADSPEAAELLHRYVAPMVDCNIDHLVLGCTHYPFLMSSLRGILPKGVEIVDPAPAVARQTLRVLSEYNLLNNGSSQGKLAFYSSASVEVLKLLAEKLGIIPDHEQEVDFTGSVKPCEHYACILTVS